MLRRACGVHKSFLGDQPHGEQFETVHCLNAKLMAQRAMCCEIGVAEHQRAWRLRVWNYQRRIAAAMAWDSDRGNRSSRGAHHAGIQN